MSPRPAATQLLGGLAVATMFRGDPQQLMEWANFHLSSGAARLYVALDRPDRALLDALPDHPSVHWEVIEKATWDDFYAAGVNVERKQVDAMRWLARMARAQGHDHLAFLDTDELLDLTVPFSDLAALHPDATAIVLPVREMWFAEGGLVDEPFGASLALGRLPPDFPSKRAFGWRAQYLRNGMLGHDLGKTIYRLPLRSGQISVHGPLTGSTRAGAVLLPDETARVLHFDCGNVVTWSAKWGTRITGNVIAGGLQTHRRAQLRLFEHVLRQPSEEQRKFFRDFYTISSDTVAELESDGMVERIDLATSLEGPLPVPAPPTTDALPVLPSSTARVDFQFALVCDRNFVKPTFATMISMLSQISPDRSVRFVVLGDGLDVADVHHLRSLEYTAYDVEVRVHDITRDLDRDLGGGATGVNRSRATYGRAYLGDYLPRQRTVYLDGDVLATRDATELFALDLGDACIAGVPDSAAFRAVANPESVPIGQRMRLAGIVGADPLEYLNAGVLVLDLDHPDFRELWLLARAYVTMEGRALAQHDQDAINLAFAGRKYRLPATYNYMTQFYTSDRCLDGDLVSAKYAAADAALIHFSGRVKPWLTRQDEFYNGLYRKLVSAAEECVGVSCGLYFSRGSKRDAEQWGPDRWAENLALPTARSLPSISPATADVELVDVTDTCAYLRLTPAAYLHGVAHGLRLVARTEGTELFEIPLSQLSHQQTHLASRAGTGIRTAPVDLVAALASLGGVARDVEVVLTSAASGDGFERTLGVLDVLAAGTAATPQLLEELPVRGAVKGLDGGWLRAWYRSVGNEPLSLHIAGEMVAHRAELPDEDGLRSISFRAGHIVVGLGYGRRGEDRVSITVSGTNVPLPGAQVTVGQVRSARAAASFWLRRHRRRVVAGVRRRLRRPTGPEPSRTT